ncbi:MAG: hypothetical protein GY869_21425, partial [Planctomycetes bacterium]|nr:hypothetical protein [Planctomycetota bacterium]
MGYHAWCENDGCVKVLKATELADAVLEFMDYTGECEWGIGDVLKYVIALTEDDYTDIEHAVLDECPFAEDSIKYRGSMPWAPFPRMWVYIDDDYDDR